MARAELEANLLSKRTKKDLNQQDQEVNWMVESQGMKKKVIY